MEPVIVTLKQHKDSHNLVFLCPEIASSFEKGDLIFVQYGLEQIQAIVVPISQKGIIAFSSNVWDALAIPFSHQVHVQGNRRTLLIGPLVGMMTTGLRPHRTHPLGHRTCFYTRFILTQKEVPASFFLFSPGDITPSRVIGYFLRQQDGKPVWSRHLVPFPAVVYNRIFRVGEKKNFVKKGRTLLEQAGVKIFNPHTFNKWQIHQLIHQRKEVQPYIPESEINPDVRTIEHLLNKYNMVYLKPAEGFSGLGIVQIIHHTKGILCRFNKHGKNHLRIYSSIPALIQSVFNRKSLRKYIAQQGINLIQYKGRTIDLRVHANKDRNGQWVMTAVAAKMSGKGSVTTHVRTGGNVLSFDKVVHSFFPSDQQQKVHQNLKVAVLSLANAIEESLSGYIGDIGFDIGIDRNGHPWMFEANSQPGRHVFAHPSMKESELLTRKIILDYALHLSGMTMSEEVIPS